MAKLPSGARKPETELPTAILTPPISASDSPHVASIVSIMPAVQPPDQQPLDHQPDEPDGDRRASARMQIQRLMPNR